VSNSGGEEWHSRSAPRPLSSFTLSIYSHRHGSDLLPRCSASTSFSFWFAGPLPSSNREHSSPTPSHVRHNLGIMAGLDTRGASDFIGMLQAFGLQVGDREVYIDERSSLFFLGPPQK